MFGFEGEVKAKYNSNILQLFSECFRALPLAAVLENHTLILHGGLFKQDGVTLQDINKIDRFTDCMNGLLEDLLWSDPMDGTGRQPSRREAGTLFGQDVTERFLKENNLKLLVRSHEVKMGGYEVQHGISFVVGIGGLTARKVHHHLLCAQLLRHHGECGSAHHVRSQHGADFQDGVF